MNGASKAVAMVTASVLAAIGIGVGIVAPTSGGKLVENIPANAQSALLTVSLRYLPIGTNPDSTVRDAITLRGPYSERSLSSTGSLACGQTASRCSLIVDGVIYNRIGYGYGKWIARRIPDNSLLFGRWSTNAGNTLRGFEQDVTGGVHEVGSALVGGVLTTEYRGELSLPELYVHQQQTSVVDFVYELSHFYPLRFPTLSAPISVWVDRNGAILQVSGSAPYQSLTGRGVSRVVPAVTQQSRAKSFRSVAERTPAQRVTVTASISDFGIPARVSAPPRSETTFVNDRTTSVAGRVSINGSTAAGLLVLNLALEPPSRGFPNGAATAGEGYVVASVAADGSYSASVFGSGTGQHLRIEPFFYPGTSRVTCKVLTLETKSTKTTAGVNLSC